MNAFIDIADTQMAAPVKAKHRANEKRAEARAEKNSARMTLTESEQKLQDQSKLLSQWRAWHRERQEALLAGPFGEEIQKIKSFLRTMSPMAPSSAPELVAMIKNGEWGKRAGADISDIRHELLVMISRGIVRVRERNGLDPFDDSLPGEAPTAYEQIREILR